MTRLEAAEIVEAIQQAIACARKYYAVQNGVPESDVAVDFKWPGQLEVRMLVPVSFDIEPVEETAQSDAPEHPTTQ